MQAIKITDKVYWVGAIDWNIRDFHGYTTDGGTTYNAFLIVDEKIVLVDTVKHGFFEQMAARIKSVIGDKKIDILISNHSEMDHTGVIRETIAKFKPSKIYASMTGVKTLQEHFGSFENLEGVADGAEVNIGKETLVFMDSKMLHWPESMICLMKNENLLFSNDIFGMHLASSKLFDDEVSSDIWFREAKKYYANIILPYSNIVKAFLAKVKAKGIAPRIICPDHGIIWRKNPQQIVDLYAKFAEQKPAKKALVIYDTMWGSTAKMAAAITDGLASKGIEVKEFSLRATNRSEVATEILDSAALIVGTPVLNQEMYPSLGDTLTYLKGLKKTNLLGMVFGSYGWSPMAITTLQKFVETMGVKIVKEPITSKFVPTEEKLKECFDGGVFMAEEIGKTL